MRSAASLHQRRGLLTLRGQVFPSLPQAQQSFALPATGFHSRKMSSYVLDGLLGRRGGGSAWQWPVTQANTVFNIVPQGHKYVHVCDVFRIRTLLSISFLSTFVSISDVDSWWKDLGSYTALKTQGGSWRFLSSTKSPMLLTFEKGPWIYRLNQQLPEITFPWKFQETCLSNSTMLNAQLMELSIHFIVSLRWVNSSFCIQNSLCRG
jgi:hypothetical protein